MQNMKLLPVIALWLLSPLFCNAQNRNYFTIFDPNRDGDGEIMKTSPQKTVIAASCDFSTVSNAEDSVKCLENVTTFDDKGRITVLHDLYAQVVRSYKYDDKNRVVEYTEFSPEKNTHLLQLAIKYDKKSNITAITNKAEGVEAKNVAYNEKEGKLILSQGFVFTDEVHFANGRISKVVARNSAEELQTLTEYFYDEKGRITKQTGEDRIEGNTQFTILTAYNDKGQKETETEEYWNDENPEEKRVYLATYTYDDKGLLIQKSKKTPDTNYLTQFHHDETGRLQSADYFDSDYFLVTIHYYYR